VIETGEVLVLDIDGTLCPSKQPGEPYADLVPDERMLARVREYRAAGWHVILQTSRQMRTYEGNVGAIAANMLPVLFAWLARWEIPYDEVHIGKPWPGHDGFYVDDRTIRPAEFLALDADGVRERLAADAVCDRPADPA
jgi:capsule biosynthesis phosphatase